MSDDEMLKHYSRALDEIYLLRKILAYEARVTEAHLDYKTFPKSRRSAAETSVKRMREAVHGRGEAAYDGRHDKAYGELQNLGAAMLTRHQWEVQS